MNKKYNIIYADPAWTYKTWTAKGGRKSASAHYSLMEESDIAKMDIKSIAADDSILFLWVTMPNLEEGLRVMNAWGFKYKTCGFNWVKLYNSGKPVVGLGYWTRANSELCLIGTKGHPKRVSKSVSQIVMSVPTKHSEKPFIVRDKIVELMGDLPRLELFARTKGEGWDAWGYDIDGKSIEEHLEEYNND